MPGTAAKKYEEGIFMKKIVKGILLLAAAAAVVTGCSRIGMGGAEAPTENSVYVAGDGSVRVAFFEDFSKTIISRRGKRVSGTLQRGRPVCQRYAD